MAFRHSCHHLYIAYSILQYLTVSYSILQYRTVSYSILQYLTVPYSIVLPNECEAKFSENGSVAHIARGIAWWQRRQPSRYGPYYLRWNCIAPVDERCCCLSPRYWKYVMQIHSVSLCNLYYSCSLGLINKIFITALINVAICAQISRSSAALHCFVDVSRT